MSTFICANCGEEHESGPEDEAVAEAQAAFGEDIDISACAVVCDGCYEQIMGRPKDEARD